MSEVVLGNDIYGDPIVEQTKICNKCHRDLPLSAYKRDGGGSKLRSWCKECDKQNDKARAEARKLAEPPPEDHVCPICNRDKATIVASIRVSTNRKPQSWVFDHDHETGMFRGWICAKCNLALGNFDHDIDRMRNAINYMMEHLK